ncbi:MULTISPECIES: hypothetical protein [unclassified Bacillus (in: firmicutes)]|uniref:hypothetical protein n=1 Tax=unclassified Bacillus (in: firmicutes) TaxID=185979 RepID=UPI001BE6EB6E|nr:MULTISPECIES: hypothetical protein [unclassified Bacillus (in: firmicutes)]MBT2638848.1 hypothetical protein [Bacillus sp. ISL-39]MBT2660990.1 hypothetical protein [Bacillus sp. ISL-45]
MLWKVFRLVIGLLCGYLFIISLSAIFPVQSEEFLGEFILNPFQFLAGAVALVFGMYAFGGLIRDGGVGVISASKGKKGFGADIILSITCLTSFLLLLPLGVWQTAIFFVFCLLYGMMSFSSPEDGNES